MNKNTQTIKIFRKANEIPSCENKRAHRFILAVETSGRMGSVALGFEDQLLAQKDFSGPMKHSSEIFPSIVELLDTYQSKANDIKEVYISVGPGSFTGLRIAVTLAKTLALANECKIIAVDTLDVIAANILQYHPKNSQDIKRLGVLLDAKRGRFFTAIYEKQNQSEQHPSIEGYEKTVADCMVKPEEFIKSFVKPNSPIWLTGEGLVYYQDRFASEGVKFIEEQLWIPTAGKVFELGRDKAKQKKYEDPLKLEPKYIQRPDIRVKKLP